MKGQTTTGFDVRHPLVHITYFLNVILFCVFCKLPVFQLIGIVCGIFMILRCQGKNGLRLYVWLGISLTIYALIINPIFNHRGETALFYINQSPVTLEMLIYGVSFVGMVINGAMWIGAMGALLSSDRVYYLLGRISPKLALFFSMTLRFIPQLKEKYEVIHQGQIALGNVIPDQKLQRIKHLGKEFSILISWSLEDSIETSDSMEARGYGLKGRTSYHLFRFERTDGWLMGIILTLSAPVWYGIVTGRFHIYYFPAYQLPRWNGTITMALAAFVLLMLLPYATEMISCFRDKKLNV